MRSLFPGLLVAAFAAPAFAKLPPLSEEAKAKAAETVAKNAWNEKVSLYQHCLVTERIASNYGKRGAAMTRTSAASTSRPVTAPAGAPGAAGATAAPTATPVGAGTGAVVIPPCEDPGPFVMTAAPAAAAAAASGVRPVELSGAHSPASGAATAPSTKATAAELSANPRATPVTPTHDKPIEASEAHSRPGTAISPPSVNATAKELETGKK